MKNKIILILILTILLPFAFIVTGCETFAEYALSTSANTNSSATEAGQMYYFYNKSSHLVKITDSTGSVTISPGGDTQIRYNKQVPIYGANYSPANLVSLTQSGTHFTFYDK